MTDLEASFSVCQNFPFPFQLTARKCLHAELLVIVM